MLYENNEISKKCYFEITGVFPMDSLKHGTVLRDYQQEMLGRVYDAWGQCRSVMVQMPTGTGKTHLMAEVIKKASPDPSQGGENGGVLVVAHRRELIEQISETLGRFGVEHGLIVSGKPVDVTKRVQVASIQMLARRDPTPDPSPKERGNIALNFSLVIVDEAHHAVAKTYRTLWEQWPEARFLGLTATPCRLDQTGFTDLFDTLLQSWTIQEFIDKGWLSDFEYVSVTPDNLMVERIAGLKKRGVDGDYQTKELATVMDCPESIEHLYLSYRQFANGKKGIVYAISREHAQHIAVYYQEHGVSCAVIDAKTPAGERASIIEQYKQNPPSIDVLVNVDIFSEGFDCPEVEFIQLARPTLSLSKYLQQVGRGMRVVPQQKDYVVILDQVGMYQTFGMPTEEREWDLMFHGKLKGLAHSGEERGYVIRNDGSELSLLNLDMVHIKRHGEKNTGVEIFVKGGKYGVMVDGRETCRAEYEHIRRIRDGHYFAIATYPYAVFKGKTTVINLKGIDMRASLYGKVTPHGEIIEGETITGQRTYWDGVGLRYYNTLPEFETVGGVEMVCKDGKYMLRQQTSYLREPVDKKDIWYNREILWMKNVLVFKKTGVVLPIAAYGIGCFFVTSNDPSKGRYLKVWLNGKVSEESISYLGWQKTAREPRWRDAQLVRASSGRLEYMDRE